MKYLSLLLALCLSLALPVAATEIDTTGEIQCSATPVSEKKLEVVLTNLQQQRTTVSIQSLDGSVVYFRDIVNKHNGYRKRLDLKELPKGKYKLVIYNGGTTYQQVIVIREDVGMLVSAIK